MMFSSNTSQVSATSTQAEAIDFDGTNDYLLRTTDLSGNISSKTLTFSAWVWPGATRQTAFYTSQPTNEASTRWTVYASIAGNLAIQGSNAAGTAVLTITLAEVITARTWTHLLLSVDLTNTSLRALYINDVLVFPTWTTYTNDSIAFNQPRHKIGVNRVTPNDAGDNRLSNVFLDYTYRDLSITANRRLFVTADLKPAAGQAALNPIMYLPMSDPTQPGLNQGTGGNFTLTGTVARSGRGPNQYNAPYSTLNNPQHLSRTTVPTGLVDGKQFTFQCSFNGAGLAQRRHMLGISSSGPNQTFGIYVDVNRLILFGRNSALTDILFATVTSPTFIDFRNYTVTVSLDLADTAKRHIYINGVAATSVTWTTYSNAAIDLTGTIYNIGALSSSQNYWVGQLGPLWFTPSYTDLSVPANLAKFVTGTGIDAKPVDPGASGELPTGTSPILYFPMYGNNAGKNYGTGGNFTVNSGPYTGVRGPNEYWGNYAVLNGTSSYLAKTSALTGVSSGKTFSFSGIFRTTNPLQTGRVFTLTTSAGQHKLFVTVTDDGSGTSGILSIVARNSSNFAILNATRSAAISFSQTYSLQISIDLADTAKRAVYLNGVLQTMTWATYTNETIDFSAANRCVLGANWNGVSYDTFWKGNLSETYFTTDYIDFSQEANRLKFRDAFGNPVNLTQQIEDAAIPNPAMYMRFPPTSFGTNSGTGGDFTATNVTDGGQL